MTPNTILGTVPPGNVHLNVQIPNYAYGGFWPHLVDIYEPITPYLRAWISLHGGSGTKQYQALITRILKQAPAIATNVNWLVMKTFKFMAVFPQGQACRAFNVLETPSTPTTGNPASHNLWNPNGVDTSNPANPVLVNGVYTWSNGHHWSGYNDPLFLQHLKQYLLSTYPSLGACHLHGHSDGGMMTIYMSAQYPASVGFASYAATSASVPKPMPYVPGLAESFDFFNSGVPTWLQYGRMDGVLGINGGVAGAGDHWADPSYWSQQPANLDVANYDGSGYGMTGSGKFVPSLEHTVPGPIGYQRIIDGYNSQRALGPQTYEYTDAVPTTTAGGDTMRTWTYGPNVMRLIENRIHKYTDQQASVGHPLVYDMFQWIGTLH